MTRSLQIGRRIAKAREMARPEELGGKIRVAHFDIIVDKEDDEFELAILPAGRCRILTTFCRLAVKTSAAKVTMSIGHNGYMKGNREIVKPSKVAVSPKFEFEKLTTFGGPEQISGFPYESMQEITVTAHTAEKLPAKSKINGVILYVCD